jgi:hypothetical protein
MKFKLPHETLTPLDPNATPTPRSVRLLRKEVYANLLSVRSALGGGGHGHLGMVMPQAEYVAMAVGNAPYVHPIPPVPPNYAGAAAVIAQLQSDYAHQKERYEEYVELAAQIKAQLLQAVPILYLQQLNHAQVGFANATPRAIIDHLLATFGEITERDLDKNMAELRAPWNPDVPIHTVFERGTACRQFAEEGDDPISEATYTRILVDIFEQSGVLETAVDKWGEKPRADRTLANCERHFVEANQHRITKLSNATRETLAANAATHKPQASGSPLRTNAPPNQMTVTSPEFLALIAKITADAVASATKANNPTPRSNRTRNNNQRPRQYCWTHGVCAHSSKDCRVPKEGHQPNATFANTMGGSTKGFREQNENNTPNTNGAT